MSRVAGDSGSAGSTRTPAYRVPPSSGLTSSENESPANDAAAPSAPSSVGGTNSPSSPSDTAPLSTTRA